MRRWVDDVRARTRAVRPFTALLAVTAILGSLLFVAPAGDAFAASVPAAPTSATAVPGNARATVSWVAPSSDGGSAVIAYVVTPYLGGVAQHARTFNSTATTETYAGLTNTESYTFTVAAKNAVGVGAASAASSPVLVGVPTAPTNATVVANLGRASVSWNAPALNGGTAVTGYVVIPYKAGVAQTAHRFTSTQLSETVTGLTNNVQYTFKVGAFNANGNGLRSAPTQSITVGAPKAPTAPVVTAITAGNAQVTLTWAGPANAGSASVSGYVVTPYVADVAQPIHTYGSATRQVVTGLTNGSTYQFTVSAENAAGTGAPSAKSGRLTVGAPTVPRAVSATAGKDRATVSWSGPASNNGEAVTGYVITPYIGTTAQSPVTVGLVKSKIITGLSHATTYTFTVAATNANGTGSSSAATNALRPNAVPVAGADAYTTDEDIPFSVSAPGLLGNDVDADGDALEIELVGFPGGGLDIRPDGSFDYEPAQDSDADDVFTYRIGDGITWSAPVRVDIDIIAVNDPPIVEGEQYETSYETTLDVGSPGVLENDYDPIEFDGLTASGPISGPSHGTLVLRSNGSFTYTPDPGFSGFDTFSYLVSDSQPGGIGDCEITVDDPPSDG